MALFTLGRTLALSLMAPLAQSVEGVVLLAGGGIGGSRIHAVALKAALYNILVLSLVVALETVDGPGVLGVVKSYRRFFGGGFVDCNCRRWISSDSHGSRKGYGNSDSDHDNGQFSCHVFTLLLR